MKTEDLKKLLGDAGTDDVINAIMAMNGKDIEAHKTKVTELQGQLDAAQNQITEANAQIEKFKDLKPDELRAAADDYKSKWEQAQADAKAQLESLKFDHALDGALAAAKAKNPKAVKALLDMDVLKKAYDEKTGAIINFDEHLKPVREQNDYLFESDKPTPKIVAGGNNKPIQTDAFEAAMRKGAGLPESQQG